MRLKHTDLLGNRREPLVEKVCGAQMRLKHGDDKDDREAESSGKGVWSSDEIETVEQEETTEVEKVCGAQMRLKHIYLLLLHLLVEVEKVCGAQMRLKQ